MVFSSFELVGRTVDTKNFSFNIQWFIVFLFFYVRAPSFFAKMISRIN